MTEEGLVFLTGNRDSNRAGDVVFVHGLRGHYRETWHPKGSRLSKEDLEKETDYFPYWLAKDYSNLGIWSYRYRAEPSGWSAKIKPSDPDLQGITMPLYDRAKSLLVSLKNNDVGQRPLVFITHSLGGLIVKKLLRNAFDTRENQDNQTIIEQTKGVVFIATPHTGSHLAVILGWLGGVGKVTVTGHELEEANPDLRDLDEWYRNHSEQHMDVTAMVFYETQPIPNLTGVVSASSANPHLSVKVELNPINADHISIAKPTSPSADVYLGTKRFIKKCLLNSQEILTELRLPIRQDEYSREEIEVNPQQPL